MNNIIPFIFEWLQNHVLESIASIIGIVNIFFGIKEKPFFWFLGIINAILFFIVYFQNGLYAYMSLQIYYIGLGAYGLYYWIKGNGKNNKQKVVVNKAGLKNGIFIFTAFLIIFAIIYLLLKKGTDSQLPFMDSLTASSAIIAAYMMVKKHIETWFVWFASDLIAISLLFYKGMYGALILQLFYFAFSIVGLIEWRKSMLKNSDRL